VQEKVVKEVMCKMKSFKGVFEAMLLTEEDRKTVFELEKQAEQRVIFGLGRGHNEGVEMALKRKIVIAFVTDAEYDKHTGQNVILIQNGEIIGEEIVDLKKLEELKNREDSLVCGTFVLYKNGVPKIAPEPPIVVILPKRFPEIEEIPHVKNAVLGSPSVPADTYLKEKMHAESREQIGTILIGFDLKNSSKL